MAGNSGPQTVQGALQAIQRAINASIANGQIKRNDPNIADIANTSGLFARLVSSRMLQLRPANEAAVGPAPRLRVVRGLIVALQETVYDGSRWELYYNYLATGLVAVCCLSTNPFVDGLESRPITVMGERDMRLAPTLPGLEALGGELLRAMTHACDVVERYTQRMELVLDGELPYGVWSARLNCAYVMAWLQEWLQGTAAWDAADTQDAELERLLFVVAAFTDGMAHGLQSFLDADSQGHREFLRVHLPRAVNMPAMLHVIARDRQPAVLHALLDGCTELLEKAAEVCEAAEERADGREWGYGSFSDDEDDSAAAHGGPVTASKSYASVLGGIVQAIQLLVAARPSLSLSSITRCQQACHPFLNDDYQLALSTRGVEDLHEAFLAAVRCLRAAWDEGNAQRLAVRAAAAQPAAAPPQPPPPPPVDPAQAQVEARAKAAKKAAKRARQRAKKAAASQGPAAGGAAQPEGTSASAAAQDAAARDPAEQAQPAEAQPAEALLSAQSAAEQPAAAEQPDDAQPAEEPEPAPAGEAVKAQAQQQQPAEAQVAGVPPAKETAAEAQVAAEPAAEDLGLGQQLVRLQLIGQPAAEEQEAQAQQAEQPASVDSPAEARPAAARAAAERPSSSGQRAPAAAREPRSRSSASASAASTSAARREGDGSLELPPGLTARRQQPAAPQPGNSGQQHERAAGLRNGRTGPAAASSGSRVPAALQQQGPGARAVAARPRPRPPAREQQASHADGSSAAL